MTRPAATAQLHPYPMPASLAFSAHPFDVCATLSEALGVVWLVQRETNREGEVSILAITADDADNTLPTFLLHERDGLVQVAIVQDNVWRSPSGFARRPCSGRRRDRTPARYSASSYLIRRRQAVIGDPE